MVKIFLESPRTIVRFFHAGEFRTISSLEKDSFVQFTSDPKFTLLEKLTTSKEGGIPVTHPCFIINEYCRELIFINASQSKILRYPTTSRNEYLADKAAGMPTCSLLHVSACTMLPDGMTMIPFALPEDSSPSIPTPPPSTPDNHSDDLRATIAALDRRLAFIEKSFTRPSPYLCVPSSIVSHW